MADGSVSDGRGSGCAMNVCESERKASLAMAALLAVVGFRRLRISGIVLLAAGAAMAFRGSTGYCPLYDTLDVDTTKKAS